MAIHQGNYSSSSGSPRSGASSPILIALLIVGIIIGLVVAGFFMMEQIAGSSSEGIDVFVQISGNDILVTLIDGNGADLITGIHVYVDGYPSAENSVMHNPPIGKPILFAGLATNVTGYAFVIVEATFADGTQTVIEYARMRFS